MHHDWSVFSLNIRGVYNFVMIREYAFTEVKAIRNPWGIEKGPRAS
jgi:hypothetical protein